MKNRSGRIIESGRSKDQDLLLETKQLWSERYGRELTDEEASGMIANVTEFFSILLEWEKLAGVMQRDIEEG